MHLDLCISIWTFASCVIISIWNDIVYYSKKCFQRQSTSNNEIERTMSQLYSFQPNEQFPVIIRDTKSGIAHLSKLVPSNKVPFYGVVGSVKSVKVLKSGNWYVHCHSIKQQEKLVATKNLAGINIDCYIPNQTSEGVVYGLTDPLALQQHPDVVKFQVTSSTSITAQSFTTRIIFATKSLPQTLLVNNEEYDVHPYTPTVQRCTNCQRLTHRKQSCNYQARCSRCGKASHSRAQCQATSPKCANCQGPHSAAFHGCPLKSKNEVTTENSDTNRMKDSTSSTTYAEKVTAFKFPTFIEFIVAVVLPILALNRNVNIVNQLVSIYKTLFKLNDNDISRSISNEIRFNAECLLKAGSLPSKLAGHENKESCNQLVDNDLEKNKNERKQLVTLKNIVVKDQTQNVILGDSTTKYIQDDIDTATQVFCIPGLSIADVQEWLENVNQMSFKNFIFHIGINSCRKNCISSKVWNDLIDHAKAKMPDTNIHFSSILPGKGNIKKKTDGSNAALKVACEKSGVFYMSNRPNFASYTGQPMSHLYSKDGIHPNIKGSNVLSKNLFSVLVERQ